MNDKNTLREAAQIKLKLSADYEPNQTLKLLHELQVHQIELEMLNDQLRHSQIDLENSRDKYMDLYDYAPIGYLTLASNGTISTINLTGAALLGVERSKLNKQCFSAFIHIEDRDRWHRLLLSMHKNDCKRSCELKLRCGNGESFAVRLDCLRQDAAGEEAQVRIVLTNISEQKQAEANFLESEKQRHMLEQQKIAQTALSDLWVARVEPVSPLEVYDNFKLKQPSILVVEDNLGYSKLIQAQVRLSTFLHQTEGKPLLLANTLAEGIALALTHKPDVVLLDLSLPDSAGISTVQQMRTALPDIPILVLTGQDSSALALAALQEGAQDYLIKGECNHLVLERAVRYALVRERIESRLRLSNASLCRSGELLQLIIRSSNYAPWDWNCEINDMYYSPRWWNMLGYAVNELPSDFALWKRLMHPDDLARVDHLIESALSNDVDSSEVEFRLLHKQGHYVSVLSRCFILRNQCGKAVRVSGTNMDLTERKLAEQMLLREQKLLVEQVAARSFSAHLQAMREQEKHDIAREIHDDLGGTLTAIKMEAYWLAEELSTRQEVLPFLEHFESMMELTDNATHAVRRIISNLRPTLLDDLGLAAALEWYGGSFSRRTGIECRVNCIVSDAYRDKLNKIQSINLFRIFQEALTNVGRHSFASRVQVEFLCDGTRSEGDDEILLSISDNGRGKLEQSAEASKSYGILGMTERVDQLGGNIAFASPEGGGFSVTVVLPVVNNNSRKVAE